MQSGMNFREALLTTTPSIWPNAALNELSLFNFFVYIENVLGIKNSLQHFWPEPAAPLWN